MSDDRNRGLTFRDSPYGELARGPLEGIVITTSHGSSVIPSQDMETYNEMAIAIAALDSLAASMVRLKQIDDETRRLVRAARTLAIDLRAEIERRIRP